MFKRVALPVLIVCLLCSVLAFGGYAAQAQPEPEKLDVVCTIFPPYDFARRLADDAARLNMLVKPGVESHAYDPTPADILAIQQADVFIYIGGENDQWVERILASVDTSGIRLVKLIDCVPTLEEQDSHGHDHGIDEHIWTSPRNAALMATAISEALIEKDGEHAATYGANLDTYLDELDELDEAFERLAENAARRELVFGDRFPFLYFTEEYGLAAYAAFPSCANDTEPSAQTIAQLIERVKADQIPVVFKIEQSNGRVADVIAEATGARVLTLHSCHNVSKDELDQGATYLSLMRANLDALAAALNG